MPERFTAPEMLALFFVFMLVFGNVAGYTLLDALGIL